MLPGTYSNAAATSVTINATVSISGSGATLVNPSFDFITGSTSLTLTGLELSGSGGSCISSSVSAALSLQNVTIAQCQIDATQLAANIDSSVFQTSIVAVAGSVTISNCLFTFSGSLPSWLTSGSYALSMSGATGTVTNTNFTLLQTGALVITDNSPGVLIQNCAFLNNTTPTVSGVAVSVSGGSNAVTIQGCNFVGNMALSGPVYSSGLSSTITISGSSFVSNSAANSGGAVYIEQGALQVSNCMFTQNVAGSFGGAIVFESETAQSVQNSIFNQNIAHTGGALYVFNGSSVAVSATVFSYNMALGDGGAIAINSSSVITITGGSMVFNTAAHSASVIDCFQAEFTMSNVENMTSNWIGGNDVNATLALCKSCATTSVTGTDFNEICAFALPPTLLVTPQGHMIPSCGTTQVPCPSIDYALNVQSGVADRSVTLSADTFDGSFCTAPLLALSGTILGTVSNTTNQRTVLACANSIGPVFNFNNSAVSITLVGLTIQLGSQSNIQIVSASPVLSGLQIQTVGSTPIQLSNAMLGISGTSSAMITGVQFSQIAATGAPLVSVTSTTGVVTAHSISFLQNSASLLSSSSQGNLHILSLVAIGNAAPASQLLWQQTCAGTAGAVALNLTSNSGTFQMPGCSLAGVVSGNTAGANAVLDVISASSPPQQAVFNGLTMLNTAGLAVSGGFSASNSQFTQSSLQISQPSAVSQCQFVESPLSVSTQVNISSSSFAYSPTSTASAAITLSSSAAVELSSSQFEVTGGSSTSAAAITSASGSSVTMTGCGVTGFSGVSLTSALIQQCQLSKTPLFLAGGTMTNSTLTSTSVVFQPSLPVLVQSSQFVTSSVTTNAGASTVAFSQCQFSDAPILVSSTQTQFTGCNFTQSIVNITAEDVVISASTLTGGTVSGAVLIQSSSITQLSLLRLQQNSVLTGCTITNTPVQLLNGSLSILASSVTLCNISSTGQLMLESAAVQQSSVLHYGSAFVSGSTFSGSGMYTSPVFTWVGNGQISGSSFVGMQSVNSSIVSWTGDGQLSDTSFVGIQTSNGSALSWTGDGQLSGTSFVGIQTANGSALSWTGNGLLNNCTFSRLQTANGSALAWTGDGPLSNCVFSRLQSDPVAFAWTGSGSISNSSFTENIVSLSTIVWTGNGVINQTVFSDNRASAGNGVMLMQMLQNLTIDSCTIERNFGVGGGGAIFVNVTEQTSSTMTISQSTFNQNFVSNGNGGALLVRSNAEMTFALTGCTVTGNTAQFAQSNGGGGAMYLDFGTQHDKSAQLTMSNNIFANNSAQAPFGMPLIYSGGGAVFLTWAQQLLDISTTAQSNPGAPLITITPAVAAQTLVTSGHGLISGGSFSGNVANVSANALTPNGGADVFVQPTCQFTSSCIVQYLAYQAGCKAAAGCGWCWSSGVSLEGTPGQPMTPCSIYSHSSQTCDQAMPWGRIAAFTVGCGVGMFLLHVIIIRVCARVVRRRGTSITNSVRIQQALSHVNRDEQPKPFLERVRFFVEHNGLYLTFFIKKSTNLVSLLLLLADLVSEISLPGPLYLVVLVAICTLSSIGLVLWIILVIKGRRGGYILLRAVFWPLLMACALLELGSIIGTVILTAPYQYLLPASPQCSALTTQSLQLEVGNIVSFAFSGLVSLSTYGFAFNLLRVLATMESAQGADERMLLKLADVDTYFGAQMAVLVKRLLNAVVLALAIVNFRAQSAVDDVTAQQQALVHALTIVAPFCAISMLFAVIVVPITSSLIVRKSLMQKRVRYYLRLATLFFAVVQAFALIAVIALSFLLFGGLPSSLKLIISTTLGELSAVFSTLSLFRAASMVRHQHSIRLRSVFALVQDEVTLDQDEIFPEPIVESTAVNSTTTSTSTPSLFKDDLTERLL